MVWPLLVNSHLKYLKTPFRLDRITYPHNCYPTVCVYDYTDTHDIASHRWLFST